MALTCQRYIRNSYTHRSYFYHLPGDGVESTKATVGHTGDAFSPGCVEVTGKRLAAGLSAFPEKRIPASIHDGFHLVLGERQEKSVSMLPPSEPMARISTVMPPLLERNCRTGRPLLEIRNHAPIFPCATAESSR